MVGYGANTNSDTTKNNIGEVDNKKEIFEEVAPYPSTKRYSSNWWV